jgi:hypothetical protein
VLSLGGLGPGLFPSEAAAEHPAPSTRPAGELSGALPSVDPTRTVLFSDQGRLELRGWRLKGLRVRWQGPSGLGESTCLDPTASGATDQSEGCALAVPRDLSAGSSFSLLPPSNALDGGSGAGPPPTELGPPIRAARVVLDRLLPATAVVDLTSGAGRIPLVHPEAVSSVECVQARCDLVDSAILVRSVSGVAMAVDIRLSLLPGTFIGHGDALESVASESVSVLHCPATIVSGQPLRRADATRMIIRVDGRCGHDARSLRWTVNGYASEVQRLESSADAVYVQLGVPELEDSQITVTASRPEPYDTVVAVARSDTRVAPQVRATLELPGFGNIDFLPTNRDAVLRPSPAGDHARLVPVPVEGAYTVGGSAPAWSVRGDPSAGGFVALRFAYRVDGLPAPFTSTDLAILTEPSQRPIREASIPAPIGASVLGGKPLVELQCAEPDGHLERLEPGVRRTVPFSQRESCRLIIHRERLTPETGTQDVTIEVNVTKLDDSARPDAHLSERMVLRGAPEPRVFWIRGIRAPFDRLTVRVSHFVDEAHDIGGANLYVNLPAAQWDVVFGEGRVRFYATAAIPTGLFRITAPSDVLTLNFGALSRLTWLTTDGREGLVALELGALGIGLAATPGFPRTLAVLGGLGVAIPIGNRGEPTQASVNLHAWVAYELRDDYHLVPTDPLSPRASHWSVLFGPSITIGNVGTNL